MGLSNFTGGPTPTGNGGNGQGAPMAPAMPQQNMGPDPLSLIINYNDTFKNEPPAMFRDELVNQTMAILIAKKKPNALLIGPAGTGKTKIAEEIARRLATKDPSVPDALKGYTVYELPLSNVVSGSTFVGQLEEKIQAVTEFICDPKNKAILFIDEIHQLMGDSQIYGKIAQIIKPALARGKMHTIGATTLQEAGQLYQDPAFNRRFSRVIVDEFTKEQTCQILSVMRAEMFNHYGNKITIDDSIIPIVVNLADEYRPAGSHRPDNAITLLDRAMGDAIVARKQIEMAAQNDPVMLAALQSMTMIPLSEAQVKETAMKLMTGGAKKQEYNAAAMKEALSVIKGQDDILEKVMGKLERHDLALFPKKIPLTLLFAGSSGVGKTEVTKIIANQLTGTKPIILNMTEYHSSASINRIIGAPAGYVGSDSNAELPFDCLESNPYQVILLDEFEKGDKSVQRLFMSAFDEGYIKTNQGKTVDFSRSIIIATTNAAHGTKKRSLGFGTGQTAKQTLSEAVGDLSKWFDTELLNRFQDILTFHSLDEAAYVEILRSIYRREAARINSETTTVRLPDKMPDSDADRITKDTYVEEFGARPAARAVRDYIEDLAISMKKSRQAANSAFYATQQATDMAPTGPGANEEMPSGNTTANAQADNADI